MAGQYRAPDKGYNHREEFMRFKWAEEFANDLENDGRKWIMFRGNDMTIEEDGETYVHPQFMVLWNE